MGNVNALAIKAPQRPIWRRPMYRAVWKLQRNVWGRAFVDLGGDHRSAVYVAGLFGLDEIYTDSPMPRAQGILAVQGRSCAS